MKKALTLLLALALLAAFPALAEDTLVERQIISCPDQNFSTLCMPEYSYDFHPDSGLTIYLGRPDDGACVNIFKTDASGRDFDAETYFNNAYLSMLKSSYGSDLLNEGAYDMFPIDDRQLPGRMCLYLENGERHIRFCVFDLQDDYFVRYEAFFAQETGETRDTLTALATALHNFRPDADFYSASRGSGQRPQHIPDEAEAGPSLQVISCPEQEFSTMCPVAYTWKYRENVGVTVSIPSDTAPAWVRVCRMGSDPIFDGEDYFQNVWTPHMRTILGSYISDEGEYKAYRVYGREMWGQAYAYTLSRNDTVYLCVVDTRDGDIVRYEANYPSASPDAALKLLDKLAEYYKPDADYYSADVEPLPAADLDVISCPELGFSTLVDPAFVWRYQEGGGVTIYTDHEDSIPYVIITQSRDLIMEPFEFIREQLTPSVKKQYGDKLLSVEEIEAYSVGGKTLPAGLYTYRLQDYTIEMLRIIDSTGKHTVGYTAKYVRGRGDATLAALDTAVSGFQPDAAYYDTDR